MPSYVGHFLLPTPTTVAGGVSKGRLSVCLSVYPHDIKKKTAASRIIKRDAEIFHHVCWKTIYFGSKVRGQVTRHKNSAAWDFALL